MIDSERVKNLKQFGGVKLSRCRGCNKFPILVSVPLCSNWEKCLDCITERRD